ncbi:MAG: MFS transporter [Planctomycetes bacterium]|nr:MFS transporter [Planctomycetota bacterium]
MGANPPSTRGQRFSWCLFDFASSAFSTIIITFVYVTFFDKVLVGDYGGVEGDGFGEALWGWSLAIAGIAMAVVSPVLGSIADRRGWRRRFLVVTTLIAVGGSALLFFPSTPGSGLAIWSAFAIVIVSNVAAEVTFVFYNAFLPHLGDKHTVGRLSGYGWALGYVGGLLCLVIALGFVGVDGFGPWLPTEDHVNVRATCLLVAGWFLVFSLPMFLFVHEPPPEKRPGHGGVRAVLRTVSHLREYPDLLRLFVARLFYNDALMAIIGLAALFMGETLGMDSGQTIQVAIWLNVAAGLGAFGFGFLDDRVGARKVVILSLVLLTGGAILAFAKPTVAAFWIAATMIGIGMGPNQSASRTMLSRMIAPSRSAEFYGFFALSGKATVWIGPGLFALIRPHVEDQRVAFLPILVLFVIGFVLVLGVDEQRGIERAEAADAP